MNEQNRLQSLRAARKLIELKEDCRWHLEQARQARADNRNYHHTEHRYEAACLRWCALRLARKMEKEECYR